MSHHLLGFLEHPPAQLWTEDATVLHKALQRHKVGRIAYVDRDGDTVLSVKSWSATAVFAVILDVAMDEKGVVEQLDRHCGFECLTRTTSERSASGHAQSSPQPFPRAEGINRNQVVQIR